MTAKIKLIALFIALSSCNEANNDPHPQMGCDTGISKVTGLRALVRCCTKEEYLAGNNVSYGGVSYWSNYTNHTWEPVSDCKKCEEKYW